MLRATPPPVKTTHDGGASSRSEACDLAARLPARARVVVARRPRARGARARLSCASSARDPFDLPPRARVRSLALRRAAALSLFRRRGRSRGGPRRGAAPLLQAPRRGPFDGFRIAFPDLCRLLNVRVFLSPSQTACKGKHFSEGDKASQILVSLSVQCVLLLETSKGNKFNFAEKRSIF